MNNVKKLLVTAAITAVFSFSVFSFGVRAADTQVQRLWGQDRFDTAIAISEEFVNTNGTTKAQWPSTKVDTVILANAFNYPDALTAAPLTRIYNAPILLSEAESLNAKTEAQLKKLGIKKVVLIGAEGVLSKNVEDRINSLGIETERFGGADRYETSMQVADRILKYYEDNGAKPYPMRGMTLVTTHNFTDALSIAPYAIEVLQPIILIPEGSGTTLDSVKGLREYVNKVTNNSTNLTPSEFSGTIFGQLDYINLNLHNDIINTDALLSSNQYIGNLGVNENKRQFFDFSHAVMASAENFPDALAGTALAGKLDAPIVFAGGEDKIDEALSDVLNKDEAKYNLYASYYGAEKIYLLGGTSVVPEGSEAKIER